MVVASLVVEMLVVGVETLLAMMMGTARMKMMMMMIGSYGVYGGDYDDATSTTVMMRKKRGIMIGKWMVKIKKRNIMKRMSRM